MSGSVTTTTLRRSLAAAAPVEQPFRHWRPRGLLDGAAALSLAALPLEPPPRDNLDKGTREANNASRRFFDPAWQAAEPAVAAVAAAMQSPEVVASWQWLTGRDFTDTFLRIEYCRDGDGFWLEPHTDIGAKRITILIYLSIGAGAESWGTDVYDGQRRFFASTPADFNCGLAFIPGEDTWHGFERRPIHGLRRTLMLNYVGPEWRARHELCFPDHPVRAA